MDFVLYIDADTRNTNRFNDGRSTFGDYFRTTDLIGRCVVFGLEL